MQDIIDILPPHFFLRFGLEFLTLILIIIYVRKRIKAHKVTKALDKKPWKPTYVYIHQIESPYYLFFDTETTGLPKDFSLPAAADDNWPRLQELYKKLFGQKFKGAHDSMCDVTATKECFFELVRHGVINIRVK